MAETGVKVGIASLVPGLEVAALEDGVVMEVVMALKVMDAAGDVAWHTRVTSGVSAVESLGALRTLTLLEERSLIASYRSADDEDD